MVTWNTTQIKTFFWRTSTNTMSDTQLPTKNAVIAWRLMSVMVLLETVAILALLVFTIVGFMNRGDDPLLAALSIVIIVAVASLWITLTLVALLRNRNWARGSTITIQILVFSVAIGAFQGIYAQVQIAWLIAIPAIITFVLALIARPPGKPQVQSKPETEAAS
jgi:hypothetical protein